MRELEKHTKCMLIETLKENNFNISAAISEIGVTLSEFNSCRSDEFFREGLDEARQIADDNAREKLLKLVDSGNASAIIKYNEWLHKRESEGFDDTVKKKVMKFYIDHAETKSKCLREFSAVFEVSEKVAERFYNLSKTEYNQIDPKERIKKQKKESSRKLSNLFDAGKLDEMGMLAGLLRQALYDSEHAEHPSERAKAAELTIKLTQRRDELEEKARREAEEDDANLFDKLDAVLSGTTPEDIAEVRAQIIGADKQIEVKA